MTPLQKIKHLILIKDAELSDREHSLDEADIDGAYEALADGGEHWDAMNEVREGETETDIECETSRHYESKSVAARYVDGSWVGWTYWYGGGKHGEPESVDWMEYAYDLTVTEEEKVVTVRTFTKVPA